MNKEEWVKNVIVIVKPEKTIDDFTNRTNYAIINKIKNDYFEKMLKSH